MKELMENGPVQGRELGGGESTALQKWDLCPGVH